MTMHMPMLFDDRALPQNKNGSITKLSDEQIKIKFLEFWDFYPKRAGNNPKYDAEKKFSKLVNNGINPETIIAGARRFAAECLRRRIVGTCYVPQTIRWLNGRMWLNDPDAGPVDEPKSLLEMARDLRERAGQDGDDGDRR